MQARGDIHARAVSWGALGGGLIGLWVFGGVIAGLGGWVEGRSLETVRSWAFPGAALAVVTCFVAAYSLNQPKVRVAAVGLALLAVFSVVILLLINPSISPPVP